LLSQFLARLAAAAAGPRWAAEEMVAGESAAIQRLAARAGPRRWADLRETINNSFIAARELNLDRKQTMLAAFFAIDEIAR
jgi:DNA polymerase III subunit delta'